MLALHGRAACREPLCREDSDARNIDNAEVVTLRAFSTKVRCNFGCGHQPACMQHALSQPLPGTACPLAHACEPRRGNLPVDDMGVVDVPACHWATPIAPGLQVHNVKTMVAYKQAEDML